MNQEQYLFPVCLCGSWVQCQGCRFRSFSESIEGFLLILPVLCRSLQFQQENLICHILLILVTLLKYLATWPGTHFFCNCEWHIGDHRAALREASVLDVVWNLTLLGMFSWDHPEKNCSRPPAPSCTFALHPKAHWFQHGPPLQRPCTLYQGEITSQ